MWEKENRMEYWYPRISNLVPKPKTKIIMINPDWTSDGNNMTIPEKEFKEIEEASKEFKFPLFMRGSETSGKHDWKDTCFVKDLSEIRRKVIALIEDALLKDIGCNSIALREFIEMDTGFYAFREMPVNSERRYFIRDGKVICHHPYWIEDAIRKPSADNWKEILKGLNTETEEIKLLTEYSEEVGKNFDGFWSIDFCKSKEDVWYCIDMAVGTASWHPKCPNNPNQDLDKKEVNEEIKYSRFRK